MAPTVCPSLESHPGLLLELSKVGDLSKESLQKSFESRCYSFAARDIC